MVIEKELIEKIIAIFIGVYAVYGLIKAYKKDKSLFKRMKDKGIK